MKGLSVILSVVISFSAAAAADLDPGWPRELTKNGARLVYYQPQLDAWKDYKTLEARVAVSLAPPGGQAAVGIASFRAITEADVDTRLVVIRNIVLTDTRFPSLDSAAAQRMDELLRAVFPTEAVTISLDRLLAELESSKVSVQPVALKTDPPKIFVSQGPAILLLVDGDPVRAPVEKTGLEFVVNTNWDLFFDKSQSRYYLLAGKTWLTATALAGPWTATVKLPPDMSSLPPNQNWDDVKKAVPPPATTAKAPQVFYSNTPAELISFKGAPVYSEIPGTNLGYAKNTDSDVFLDSGQNQYYYLISGRWFRAKTLDGPWSYAGNDLPADFARIPPDSPVADVLASVPGRQEAEDAVLLAQVPTTAVVNRAEAEAKVKVVYDGPPQFKPIESTSLDYATNTPDKVIQVGDLYYLCFQGVWFMSTKPDGPWKTADSVPQEIYTIPPSSPVYNVTYVTQVNPTPTTVECSHTSGYIGMFVIGAAVGATIAYGTGWYYPPYIYYGPYPYPIYRPYPYTYGVGAVYYPNSGTYRVGHAVYGPYGAAGGSAWYNPSTGRYGRSASAQSYWGGRTVASTYNPWTGGYAATRQGSSPYAQWGSSVAVRGDDWVRTQHVTTSQGTRASFQTSEGGYGAAARGAGGQTGFVGKGSDNNVYAGKDGNIYKKDSNGSWQKYDNGNWNPVDTSAAKGQASQRAQSAKEQRPSSAAKPSTTELPSSLSQQRTQSTSLQAGTTKGTPSTTFNRSTVSPDTMQGLNKEAQARQRGAQQSQRFNSSRQQGGARLQGRTGGGLRSR